MVATSRRAPRHVDADGRQRRADPGVTPALGTSPLGDGFQKRRLLSEAWATFCGEVGRTWYRGRAENRGFPSSSGEGGLIGPPRSARDGLDRAALAHRGYTHCADMMTRLPALLLAGCVVSAALILLGRGFIIHDSTLLERSPPTTETGAQAREIAEPGATQRAPEAASTDHAGDLRPSNVRLSGIVIEPDRRIAIFAVTGAKSVALLEGEALNDWRVDSISAQQVSLSGPSGTMTLKPKSDATLVRPAAPSASPASQPQPGAPPRFLNRPFQWFPAPAGLPRPTPATLIAAIPAPAPVQDYYDYAPYSHDDYSLPYYAYSVPVELWSRFFHNHHFHPGGFHRAFRGGGVHGGLFGVGFHAGGGGHGGHR